jgi:predicted MPP superfamily phosphohydrolase
MIFFNGLTHHCDLPLPHLPQSMDGLSIAHVSDLHIARHRPRHRRIVQTLCDHRPDMVIFTGDYITRPGEEAVALDVMRRITADLRPPRGMFGVFGNHDSPPLRQAFAGLPIRWLNDDIHRFDDLPLEILGADTCFVNRSHDSLALVERMYRNSDKPCDEDARPVRLLLCHMPNYLPTAADLRIDLMFAGHTHGGQCRLPGKRALMNSSDLPLDLTSGLLRHRHTICAVTRGLGEVLLPMRVCCGAQLPIYRLRRGAQAGQHTPHVRNVQPW